MKVHDLVARLAAATTCPDPMAGARAELEALRAERSAIAETLAFIAGTGGNAAQTFYRSPELTLLKVSFPNGRRTPPHDHGTWALILVLAGRERNTLYRDVDGGGLRRASVVTLEAGDILPMRETTVHVAECLGDTPALGLHVYGGDIASLARRMWNPETLEPEPLEWSRYEAFARIASRAPSAP